PPAGLGAFGPFATKNPMTKSITPNIGGAGQSPASKDDGPEHVRTLLTAPHNMKPLAPISNTVRLALGILFFVLFFAAWGYATLGGYVSKTFLADPLTMLEEGWLLLTKHGFIGDIGITIWRVVGGFVL